MVGLLALTLTAAMLLISPVARIDRETCGRIQPGMTLKEVQQIIGALDGWHDGVAGMTTDPTPLDVASHKQPGFRHWWGSRGEILIEFDDRDRVRRAQFSPAKEVVRHWSVFVWQRLTRGDPEH